MLPRRDRQSKPLTSRYWSCRQSMQGAPLTQRSRSLGSLKTGLCDPSNCHLPISGQSALPGVVGEG